MAEWKRVVPIIRRQEDETGFHYKVAETHPFLIRTDRFRMRPPRESFLMRGGDHADVGF